MLYCVQVIALGEVLMVAKKSGLDMTQFWHAIRASVGNSFMWETGGPYVLRGDYHEAFTLDLQIKDIKLFEEMARTAGVPTELMDHTKEIYEKSLETYGPAE